MYVTTAATVLIIEVDDRTGLEVNSNKILKYRTRKDVGFRSIAGIIVIIKKYQSTLENAV